MSEPTLIEAFPELQERVAHELGWPGDVSDLTSDQQSRVNRLVNDGYRKFLWPRVLPGEAEPHKWSFLCPHATLTIWPTTTGTVDGTPTYDGSTYSTITVTAAAFYANMVGESFTFGTSGTSYTIASYVSTTSIKVTGDASGETADDSFTITADGDYDLPDNFGGMTENMFIVSTSVTIKTIKRVGASRIYVLRGQSDYTDTPHVFAVVPASHDMTEGQRYRASFYPTPDAVRTVTYRYNILPNKLTATATYPHGVEMHSRTMMLACLAEVDRELHIDNGHKTEYEEALEASVKADRRDNQPATLGYNDDHSVSNGISAAEQDRYGDVTYTYNGVEI